MKTSIFNVDYHYDENLNPVFRMSFVKHSDSSICIRKFNLKGIVIYSFISLLYWVASYIGLRVLQDYSIFYSVHTTLALFVVWTLLTIGFIFSE